MAVLGGYSGMGDPLKTPQSANMEVEFSKTDRKMCIFPDDDTKGSKSVLLIIT